MSPAASKKQRSPVAWAAAAAVAGLVGFHVWLFCQRVTTASLLEPGVALRWLGAMALMATGTILHRRGLLRGNTRAIVVLSLVAALLHSGATVEGAPDYLPAEILLAAATGCAVLALAMFRSAPSCFPGRSRLVPAARTALFNPGHTGCHFGRAPPFRS